MNLNDTVFIAIDTETTGKYPLESEICEIAAVKFKAGKRIDAFSSLIKPSRPMSEEVIKIHGITNEMVQNAASIEDVIKEFHRYIGEDILVAHHAPFDMGFIAIAFENAGLSLPITPVLCSSRISRNVIKDSVNHKLQTLIPHLGLTQGAAHRAEDDAHACGELLYKCIERSGAATLEKLWELQGGPLRWPDFSIEQLCDKDQGINILVSAIRDQRQAYMKYGGSNAHERLVTPIGIIRGPDGDFLMASDGQPFAKRFYLSKISDVRRA
ncbi:MAG: 3'-5' exonuclease [Bdellovibrionaceae bacterium]|nr:3'-5' exonuclease [Pseudobdellovibrionaceae bacterium]